MFYCQHEKGFARLLKNWKTSIEKKLAKVRSIYTRVEREFSWNRKDLKEKAQRQLHDAVFNLEIVKKRRI